MLTLTQSRFYYELFLVEILGSLLKCPSSGIFALVFSTGLDSITGPNTTLNFSVMKLCTKWVVWIGNQTCMWPRLRVFLYFKGDFVFHRAVTWEVNFPPLAGWFLVYFQLGCINKSSLSHFWLWGPISASGNFHHSLLPHNA